MKIDTFEIVKLGSRRVWIRRVEATTVVNAVLCDPPSPTLVPFHVNKHSVIECPINRRLLVTLFYLSHSR